ncbi:MAG TPA: Na+/H+ antiporter NhaA [Bryobacteraceae bacterium]|nr:Na+/H+ antiporter NhaA [Bryobacteraceae bacterium]
MSSATTVIHNAGHLPGFCRIPLPWHHRNDRATTAVRRIYSFLCGIGFTMSVAIGLLSFAGSPEFQDALKVGVLAARWC